MKDSTMVLYHSIIRTITPLIVGSIMAFLISSGIPATEELEMALEGFLTVGATTLYYVVARLLETKLGAKWGWLLGAPTAPTYTEELGQ